MRRELTLLSGIGAGAALMYMLDPDRGGRRAAMGRVVSHPHAIRVESNWGRVTLSGNILESEVDDLLSCAASVHGVREVENRLTPHAEAGGVPDLQGGRTR